MDFVRSLAIESWTLYSFGLLLVLCRLMSRRIRLGNWRLQIDDWLMVFATISFTGVVASVNQVAPNGSSYMSPEAAAALTPKEHDMAVWGSKMTLALEIFTLTTLWTVKACLLILYWRLTEAVGKQQLAIKAISVYCAVSYALVVGLYLGYWCHPIHEYWAVPYNNSQCATYYHHMIFATSFNISSDLMLLAIPIPVVLAAQLALKRKIILCCVLGLGVFNIIVAILNRYYNFSNPDDLGFLFFYVAEVATAIYVGNIPLCWPLFQKLFQAGKWTRDSSDNKPTSNQPRTRTRSRGFTRGRSAGSSLWSITKDETRWDKMEDSEDQKLGGSELETVAEDHSSTIELTPGWHHDANWTTVNAEPGPNSSDASSSAGFDDRGGVNIVRTVEVSHTGSRGFSKP